jgi:2-dehydro-3-deoxygluconokinase
VKLFDIVSIGEPMIEFNQTKPGEPAYLQGFGGDTSNMIIAAARQGARAAYVSRLGDDEFGRMFRELWKKEGVDASGVGVDAAAFTAAYFVTHGEDGHAFSYLRAGSAANRMKPEHVQEKIIANCRFMYASGISLAVMHDAVTEAFRVAKAAGAKIAFDANLRQKLWPLERAREAIARAAAMADYFFPSLEDAQALSGKTDEAGILAWAHGLGARNVFLKLGAHGVIVSDGSSPVRVQGCSVRFVDATGAGDCFAGAALARLCAGDGIVHAARYANAAAALKTTGYGAVGPIPHPEAVRGLLESAECAP